MGGFFLGMEEKEPEKKQVQVVVSKLVIDALKPREISIVDIADMICLLNGVKQLNITVREVDARTETIRITIYGEGLDVKLLNEALSRNGIAIRSIDEVSAEKSEQQ